MDAEKQLRDLQRVMAYTGWNRQTAQNAIDQWRQYDPAWNSDHIELYLRGDGCERAGQGSLAKTTTSARVA